MLTYESDSRPSRQILLFFITKMKCKHNSYKYKVIISVYLSICMSNGDSWTPWPLECRTIGNVHGHMVCDIVQISRQSWVSKLVIKSVWRVNLFVNLKRIDNTRRSRNKSEQKKKECTKNLTSRKTYIQI